MGKSTSQLRKKMVYTRDTKWPQNGFHKVDFSYSLGPTYRKGLSEGDDNELALRGAQSFRLFPFPIEIRRVNSYITLLRQVGFWVFYLTMRVGHMGVNCSLIFQKAHEISLLMKMY